MKLLLLGGLLFASQSIFGQFAPVKGFNFSQLEGKKLLVPTYAVSASFAKKMIKKGKLDDLASSEDKVAAYNRNWEEAMAESSYDASDYEITGYDRKKLIKEKNQEAILLYYYYDDYGNRTANLMVTHPKKKTIARVLTNGMDLSDKNDIRLMINMLNEALNTSVELENEGNKNYKGARNKYKENFVSFYEGIEDKTFLVPKSEHKNEKKATQRTADLKSALNSWKLSEYELTTTSEIENKRIEGDEDAYYWRDIPYYTQNILVVYHYNYIISADSDDVLFMFLGKSRLKPATLEKIESKMAKKYARYKSQLAK
ncbi:hypothetical protein [Putridiphycobacter roseus]|nr:hypothetical protein [Putridiphycobacter roseus]